MTEAKTTTHAPLAPTTTPAPPTNNVKPSVAQGGNLSIDDATRALSPAPAPTPALETVNKLALGSDEDDEDDAPTPKPLKGKTK